MEKNIYIVAMEIGNEYGEVTYSFLKNEIERKLDCTMDPLEEITFLKWFRKSFNGPFTPALKASNNMEYISDYINVGTFYDGGEKLYRSLSTSKFYIKGKTVRQYLEYVELVDAREQAKKAQQSSTIAIGIAILTLLISIYFSATTPKPPYDVNVLEKPQPIKEIFAPDPVESIKPDHDKAFHLKKSIQELKDELNKADELIRYYESNDYINKEIAKRNIGKI